MGGHGRERLDPHEEAGWLPEQLAQACRYFMTRRSTVPGRTGGICLGHWAGRKVPRGDPRGSEGCPGRHRSHGAEADHASGDGLCTRESLVVEGLVS